jgi:hypothetical protein
VASRPEAQLRLNRVIEAPNGDARHTSVISLQSHGKREDGAGAPRRGQRGVADLTCGSAAGIASNPTNEGLRHACSPFGIVMF